MLVQYRNLQLDIFDAFNNTGFAIQCSFTAIILLQRKITTKAILNIFVPEEN